MIWRTGFAAIVAIAILMSESLGRVALKHGFDAVELGSRDAPLNPDPLIIPARASVLLKIGEFR